MKVGLLVVTDGRVDYLTRALDSVERMLRYPFDPQLIVDDSGTTDVLPFLSHYGRTFTVTHLGGKRGLAKTVQFGWKMALEADVDYLFHLEEDFVFNLPVDVRRLAAILEDYPHLAQISLKRQPWSAPEVLAGGFMQQQPESYVERVMPLGTWCEHRQCFSLNPCLIPRRVLALGWPDGNEAEMTTLLNADPDTWFAVYGAKDAPPAVEHIGYVRSAAWAP